ncbi:MAG TPA: tetratricopeptide repeat protein [Verrucomicrobiae bacterium]|nr:tetratricopeptide repeat protein [Verrucomicrobiae bacterium]
MKPKPLSRGASSPLRPPIPGWFWSVILAALVIIAYLPAFSGGFIWDDDSYVTQNFNLRDLAGLGRIWFAPATMPQYYPLAHSSFWLEYHLWGLNPFGYHCVNILLHALAAILLYRTLARLRLPGAWLAAAIFALHPVQVESAAWVTERKNVLSAVFYFAAALAWLRFRPLENNDAPAKARWKWYALALLFFIAALLSKTVTCSLPAALLLVCWWKKGKVRWADVRPLIPFFIIGVFLGLFTSWTEKNRVGAEGPAWALTFAQRVLIAGRALWFYADKLVWPVNLTFVYPRWRINTAVWWQWLFPAAVIAVIAALAVMRRRLGRGPLAAVLLFIGTLGPALGFINVYPMRFSFVADHFQYLATVALIVLFAAWASRWPHWASALLLAVLAILTWRQTTMYASPEILWRATLARNPDALLAHNELGVILLEKGRAQEAAAHFQKILELDPNYAEAHYNLGMILFQNGQIDDAAAQFQRALEIAPNYDSAHNGLGSVLLRRGQLDDAIARFQKALELNPLSMNARLNLGLALAQKGRLDDAISQFEKCLLIDPQNAPTHGNLGDLFLKKGRVADSVAHYQAALDLQPANPAILNDLAWIRAANADARFRDGAEAVRLAERACQITDYKVPIILNTLATAYAEAGRFDEAVATAEKTRQLAISMGSPEAAGSLLKTIQLFKSHRPYHETPN